LFFVQIIIHFFKLTVTETVKEEVAITTRMVTSNATILVTIIMEEDISVVLVAVVEPPGETWIVGVSIHNRSH
jgi:hypothetical protein